MLKLIALSTLTLIVEINGSAMLGPGIWSLTSIGECPTKVDNELITFEFNKHKLNRTHDGISITMVAAEDVDDTYGMLIEICKYVDGGCKPYQVISDNDMVGLLNKYSKESVVMALTMANIDPPEFPIEKGEYHVDDYVMEYCNLPRDAVYGEFEATAYLLRGGEQVACVKCVGEFNKFEDEDICDA